MEKLLRLLVESSVGSRLIWFGMLVLLLTIAEIDTWFNWSVDLEDRPTVFRSGIVIVVSGVVLSFIEQYFPPPPKA